MPGRNGIVACHPASVSFDTSSSFRGVPSGFEASNSISRVGIHDGADDLGELANRDVFARADVDVLVVVVVVHQVDAAIGEIIDVKEFAARRPASPQLDASSRRRASRRGTCGSCAGSTWLELEIEVVVRPVQIRRHRGDEVAPVLPPVRLAQLDAGDLRDRVRLVRRLERTGQQLILGDRLRRQPRIDARATEVQQLPARRTGSSRARRCRGSSGCRR